VEDGRCKLGLAGRLELVGLIESGHTFRAAAAALNVAPATAHRWWWRWADASEADRRSRACLRARPPVPKSCPWGLGGDAEQQILRARERTNLGPARLAGIVGFRRSTIWKVLRRHGRSRRRRSPRPRFTRRYEWAEPGALLHMDAKQLPVFTEPGHWVDGNRTLRQQRRPVGSRRIEFAHCVVDDHSRLAYVEIHPFDRGEVAAAVLGRAIAWFAQQGCRPVEAVMTDNAFAYRHSNAFAHTLAAHHAKHIRTPPRTPRWNGKVERFIRTLDEEWAHGRVWPNSTRRNRALASFLRYYNRRRPHTSLGDRPPISRVHQDRGQNT
jgi:transposase InsO family protein